VPNIRDVAKLAGVAPITVSRAVNNSGYISRETRERVEAAIEELDYVPNMLGPSLRFQQTQTLAAVVSDITNPFWTTVIRGIEDVAQANGYSTVLCNTDESETKQEQYLQMLLRRRVDGVLLVPACSDPASIGLIKKQGIPVVVIDRQVPNVDVDIVRADSEEGACRLTQHLLSLGHRRIAMLTGPKSASTAVDRIHGCLRAMEAADLRVEDDLISWGQFTQESGYNKARGVIDRNPRPTAIFAANNFIAIGAIQALKEKGLRIPEDMALVSIDDIPPAYAIEPFLTVAIQPADEMGRQAARLLLDRIKNPAATAVQQIILPTTLIVRASSGGRIGR
jgi:LacI family transcriptional regulator